MRKKSFLKSPTIRLHLENASGETTYIVHRGLLSATALLSSARPRDTYVFLPAGSSPSTVENALEWLYTSAYTLPEPRSPVLEDEVPLLQSNRLAPQLPESPLVYAAIAAGIGVWGRSAPVFSPVDNTSSYVSEYFPDAPKPGDPSAGPPSPPLTPELAKFPGYAPVLAKAAAAAVEGAGARVTAAKSETAEHAVIVALRAHLDVYRFATLEAVGMRGLAEYATGRLRGLFAETKVEDLSLLTTTFAEEAFCIVRPCDALQELVVELAASRAAELARRKEFTAAVKDGGEFIARLFSKLAIS